MRVRLVDGVDLGDEGVVLGRLLVLGGEERIDDVGNEELAGDLSAKAEDVGVKRLA